MSNTAERARATLKRLVELKLQPTPDNYRRVFDSLNGDAPAHEAAP